VRRAADPDAHIRKIMINSNRSRFRRRVTEYLTPEAPQGHDFPNDDGDSRPELISAPMSLPAGQRAVLVLRYWMGPERG